MLEFSNVPSPPMVGGEVSTMEEDKAGKRQVNYYVEKENDGNIRSEVFARKEQGDLTYSASRLTNEALRIFFMVKRFQREYRDIGDPYDLVRDAVLAHYGVKKKK